MTAVAELETKIAPKLQIKFSWKFFSIHQQRLHILRCHNEFHLKVNIDPHRCFSFPRSIWIPGFPIGLKVGTYMKIHCDRSCVLLWPQVPQGSGPIAYGPFCEFGLAPEIALNWCSRLICQWVIASSCNRHTTSKLLIHSIFENLLL